MVTRPFSLGHGDGSGKRLGKRRLSVDTESALHWERKGSPPDTAELDWHVAPAQVHARPLGLCCLCELCYSHCGGGNRI